MTIAAHINLARAVMRMRLTSEEVFIKRASEGTRYNGRWEPGETTLIAISASVQPYTENQFNLNEGVRTTVDFKIFSTSEIRPAERTEQTAADLIVYRERDYEVLELRDWSLNGNYWQARLRRVGQ